MKNVSQADTCKRIGSGYYPPLSTEKVGIAVQTMHLLPLNALRVSPENGTCGWYIWGGEQWSNAVDFFSPLHVQHLSVQCPEIVPFLGLAPGYRVLLAPNYEDVWFDDGLHV